MADALLGRQLANYRIEHLHDLGGMARVYYGTDVRLKRPVAIKVLDERLRARAAYAERFVREAQTVAAWRHENILQVYYADETEGVCYFVTEFIDGANLENLLKDYAGRGELLPHADVLHIGRAIANALDYAHQHGVIHRDVKPANVLIERSGRVVLGDFGLSLEVQKGTLGEVVGSPHYISPEQARQSSEAVPVSDFYSLGVILYEMLTGTVPFDDPSPFTIALQHVTLPPPPPRKINPELNEETGQVLVKALSKSPQERYQTGRELMDALEKALSTPQPAQDEAFSLPQVPASDSGQAKRLSRLTLLDILAEHPPQLAGSPPKTASRIPEAALPPPGYVSVPARGNKFRIPAILAGCFGVILLAVVVLTALMLSQFDRFDSEAGPTQMTVAAAAPSEPSVLASATPPLPQLTPTSTGSAIPATASATAPTTTTSTPTETPIPAGGNITAVPTVKYPEGKHIQLLYNENSFYVFNLTDERLAFEPIAFERLEDSGETSNRFDGTEWAILYGYIWPKNCVKAEIRNSRPYLSPSVCMGYNATRTYKRNEEMVFWTPREGSSQFRVLWDEEEIARCEIDGELCDVYLPR